MRIIDCENHFFTRDYLKYVRARKNPPRETVGKTGPSMWYTSTMNSPRSEEIDNKMCETGTLRLREMDENGIERAILSLSPPGVQTFEPQQGTNWAKSVNSELAVTVEQNPGRYTGFMSVAPQKPDEAAAEIERCATSLGLKGLALHSHARDEYLDAPKYRTIFEKASKYDLPVYIHPAIPSKLILPGYEEYGFELAGPVLGFAADVALH
jgi:5-carboxyvanillate decarboxylase